MGCVALSCPQPTPLAAANPCSGWDPSTSTGSEWSLGIPPACNVLVCGSLIGQDLRRTRIWVPGPIACDPPIRSHSQVFSRTDGRSDAVSRPHCGTRPWVHRQLGKDLCQHVHNLILSVVWELTKLSSFVDRDMFICYYGGGIGRGDSTAVAEPKFDPVQVVCKNF